MEWSDDGIIIGFRRHGEGHAVIELMTREHGRHLGLVLGGSSRRQLPSLQPGNSVRASWYARLDEHLGNYRLETVLTRTDRMMLSPCASFGLQSLAALLRLLPERDAHPGLYTLIEHIADHLDTDDAAALLARFELQMLTELGVGLDLSSCAVTGRQTELVYVSPKTGRAVSREAGREWQDRLLALPSFLHEDGEGVSPDDIAAAFTLTGYFLTRYVMEPREIALPEARAAFLAAIGRDRAA